MQGARVRCLVRKLRSLVPCGTAKKEKKKKRKKLREKVIKRVRLLLKTRRLWVHRECAYGGEWDVIAVFNYLKAYVEKSYSAFLRPTLNRICGRNLRQMEGYSWNIPFASHLLQPLQLGRTMWLALANAVWREVTGIPSGQGREAIWAVCYSSTAYHVLTDIGITWQQVLRPNEA